MDYRLVCNTTDSPVIISKDGRTLGGGEFGAVDADDKTAAAEIDAGRLIVADENGDADSRSDQANAAIAELEQLRGEQSAKDAAKADDEQSSDAVATPEHSTRRRGSRADTTKE